MKKPISLNLDELKDFVTMAKRACYASGSDTYLDKRTADGAAHYSFVDGKFSYTDTFHGALQARGHEIVRLVSGDDSHQNTAIWGMNYFCSLHPDLFENPEEAQSIVGFLKKNLRAVRREEPFRGIEEGVQTEGVLQYSTKTNAIRQGRDKMVVFDGEETLRKAGRRLILTSYHGGLIVPNQGIILK